MLPLRNQCLAYLISAPLSTGSSSRRTAQLLGARSRPAQVSMATGASCACMDGEGQVRTKTMQVGKQEA